jgi:hypothetical protein
VKQSLVALVVGAGFGFVLVAARLNEFNTIHRMLLLQELDVYLHRRRSRPRRRSSYTALSTGAPLPARIGGRRSCAEEHRNGRGDVRRRLP